MKLARTLLPLFILLPASVALALPASSRQPVPATLLPYEAAAPAAPNPSLYSFVDVYRLAVSGGPFEATRDAMPFSDAQGQLRSVSRTSNGEAAGALPGLRFSVSAPRDGGHWPLLLAGIFACAWVAHRRLTSLY